MEGNDSCHAETMVRLVHTKTDFGEVKTVIAVITCLTRPTVGDMWRPIMIQAAGTTVRPNRDTWKLITINKVQRSDKFDSSLDC